MQHDVKYKGLVRTPENGNRRSRTLMLDDGSAQVQSKEAKVNGHGRYLQIRYWTQETDLWTHQVIDPTKPGLAGIIAVGYGKHENESWAMARDDTEAALGIKL